VRTRKVLGLMVPPSSTAGAVLLLVDDIRWPHDTL
jgi:hypothetical protein